MFTPGGHPGTVQRGPVHGTFGWSELVTRDTRAAKAFYSELFNWRTKVDENAAYNEFQVGSQSIGGMLEMKPEMQGVPPQDIPKVGRFAVFQDPSGAALAVIQRML